MPNKAEVLANLTAVQVRRYMDLVIEVIGPSAISSHVKGDVMYLLEHLRDEEILRRVAAEAKKKQ